MASTSLPTTDTRPEESHNIPHAPTTGSVEMSNLQSQSIPPSQLPAAESMPAPAPSAPLSSGAQTVTTTSQLPSQPTETSADISTMPPTTSDATAQQPALTRQQTEAIGPSTDSPTPVAVANTNAVHINLLLTNGARHPYTVDERYLKKRGVTPEGMDPFHLSVYNLKELILRDWRSEWEAPPAAPGSIRLIHFGRMLDDKSPLKDCRFSRDAPNVLHMTVKPPDIVEDEDAKIGKGSGGRAGDGTERSAGCRCVIL